MLLFGFCSFYIAGGNYNIEAECNFLRREQENKKKRAKYKVWFPL